MITKIFCKKQYCYKLFLIILSCILFVTTKDGYAQQQTVISGKVTDAATGGVLSGVSVVVKGTTNGVTTSADGAFVVTISEIPATLVFSYIGYVPKEIVVNSQQPKMLNVRLSAGNKKLNELVVIGYGDEKQEDVTGSISTIQAEDVRNLPVASFDLKLQGQAAGVVVKQATGFPGASPVIRIRGAGSIGAGDNPLYVIDGFPVPAGYSKYRNPLATINPNDIASITVLKDAASTAIYGSRGANGVILITTKSAKSGVSKLSVDAYYGVQYVQDRNRFHMMTAEEMARFRIQARKDKAAFNGVPFDESMIPDDYKNPESLGKGTDWFDVLTRAAPVQNYNVTYTNGTDKMKTMVSGGYFRQDGIVKNTDFQRYSVRANLDFKISDHVKAGVNIAPSYSLRHLAETEGHFNSGILVQGYLSSPLPPVRQPDDSFTPSITSTDLFDNANPLNILMNTDYSLRTLEVLSNAYLDIEPIENLHIKSTFNIDFNHSATHFFRPSTVGGFRSPPPQSTYASFTSAYRVNWLNENTLTYARTFGGHSLSLLLGYTIQSDHYESNYSNGNEFPSDDLHTVEAGTIYDASTNIEEWRLLSYIGRLKYNYKDKYLATAAIRRDGSSRFGPNNRWANFPSVSAGWRVSREEFFPEDGFITDLKIRASYGLAGNNNIGNYRYIPAISSADYAFNDHFVSGSRLSSLANFDLGWELSRQTDVGLDISILNNRLSLTVDYYKKHTESMLQSISVPSSSGFTSAYTNIGNVENKGWEFAVHSTNFSGNFNWQTDFNISFNSNKVLDIGDKSRLISGTAGTNITVVGKPMGMFYGYRFLGIFQSQEEIDKYPHQSGTIPGNVKYADVNDNGHISSLDRTIIGNSHPDFTWGMTNTFSYKSFDLRILIDGSQGMKVLDLYKRFMDNLDGVFNVEQVIKNRWRSPENPGNGLYATTVDNTGLAREVNSRWVKDASYLCVRNISLGYTFQTKFIPSARVYISGQNLLWITSYKGSAPDISYNADNSLAPNVNYTGYPVSTMITGGINFTF